MFKKNIILCFTEKKFYPELRNSFSKPEQPTES